MEKLCETSLLKFNSDTLVSVRKEFNLDKPGIIEQSLDLLDQWLAMQHHIVKKDFPKELKERTLINCKGSVQRVKEKIDKACTLKTLLPQYFDTFDANADYEPYRGGLIDAILPSLTPNNERIFFLKYAGIKTNSMMGYNKRFIKMLDYIRRHDYMLGLHVIIDCLGANVVEFAAKLNPIEVQQVVTILVDAYALRLKSVIFITSSRLVDVLVTIIKQAMSAKLRQRVCVMQNYEELYKHYPMEIMPREYGGTEKTLDELNDDLNKALTSEEFVSYLKEMSQAVTNEELRSKISYNEQVMGMPGSFRKLAVD